MKKIILHQVRVQETHHSGSESRCFISRKTVVLLNDGKWKRRKIIRRFFEIVWKVLKTSVDIILALGSISELAIIFKAWFGW